MSFSYGVALGLILGAAIATPVGILIGAARRRMLSQPVCKCGDNPLACCPVCMTLPALRDIHGDVTLVPNSETFR